MFLWRCELGVPSGSRSVQNWCPQRWLLVCSGLGFGGLFAGGSGDLGAKHCRRRKARTVFSDHQLTGLEKRFEAQRYLSTPERVELANALNLSETQVSLTRDSGDSILGSVAGDARPRLCGAQLRIKRRVIRREIRAPWVNLALRLFEALGWRLMKPRRIWRSSENVVVLRKSEKNGTRSKDENEFGLRKFRFEAQIRMSWGSSR